MDIELIESLVEEHGMIATDQQIIDIMRSKFDVDASPVINPPAFDESLELWQTRLIYVPFTDVEQAYREYRAARRMSAPVVSFNDYCYSIARTSSPSGAVQSYVTSFYRTLRRVLRGFPNCPHMIMLDQNTRLDYDPSPILSNPSLRIQLHINDSCNIVAVSETDSLPRLRKNCYRIRGDYDTSELEANGWDIIRTTDGKGIGACLPVEVDPEGNELIVFRVATRSSNASYSAEYVAECIAEISSRWSSDPETENAITNEHREIIENLRAVANFGSTANRRVTTLENSVELNRTAINQHASSIATLTRDIHEDSAALESLRRDLPGTVLEEIRSMFCVHERVAGMRPIQSAEIIQGSNGPILSATTYRFGMSWDGTTLRLPAINYQIDMMANSYSRGIKVRAGEDVTGYGHIHPHASGDEHMARSGTEYQVCWGDVGRRPLPEAWGRRDWTTLMRLLIGWNTQFDGRSPLTSWYYMAESMPLTSVQGWHIPGETPGIAEEEPAESTDVIVNI